MHQLRLKPVRVLLSRLQLHIRALDHFLEDLNLARFFLQLALVLLIILFPLLLMPLLQDSLLIGQLLVPTNQLADIL